MTDELKPCAHCNHDAKFVREIQMSPESPVLGYILCPNCGMRTGCMLLYSEAIAAWNTWHEPDTLPEWVKEAIEHSIETLNGDDLIQSEWRRAFQAVLSLRKPDVRE